MRLARPRASWRWVLTFALAALGGCRPESSASKDKAPPKVKVSRPVQRTVIDYAYFTGRTEAEQSVDIKARVTGYLVSVDFVPGAEVTKDQQLFEIDPRPYQAALDVANGQVNLAEAQLVLAKADLARAQEVAKTPGAISKKDIDKYIAAESEAEASKEAALANAEAAKLNVEFTRLNSPIQGEASRNLLTIGNLVTQDQTLLTTVVSQDPMFAYFDVDEFTVLRVQEFIREGKLKASREVNSLSVDLGLSNEGTRYPHAGKLNFVDNALDASTGTLQVRGEFPNPSLGKNIPRLLTPGLFVRIRLPISSPYEAILIPQAAIGTDQGLKYVLVVNDDNIVEYRPVNLGPQQPNSLQVVLPIPMLRTPEGLQPIVDLDDDPQETAAKSQDTVPSLTANDRVIVSGLQRVHPGLKVMPIELPPPAGNATPPAQPATTLPARPAATPDQDATPEPETKPQPNPEPKTDSESKPDPESKPVGGDKSETTPPATPATEPSQPAAPMPANTPS